MPARILVVDDESSVRRLFAQYLVRAGMAVTEAEDGAIGLDRARRLLPDAVVSDLEMPNMNGEAMCRALRADPATRGIPIVVVSGGASVQAQSALAAGCNAVLGKPCSRELLVATIRQLLSAVRRISPAAEPPIETPPPRFMALATGEPTQAGHE